MQIFGWNNHTHERSLVEWSDFLLSC